MKKIMITIFSMVFLGLFVVGCENTSSPEINSKLNSVALNKKDSKKVYNYKLLPFYTKEDYRGTIKIQITAKEGEYYFHLRAFNLKGDTKYWLKAKVKTPVEVVCPYTISPDELLGLSEKNGNLEMSGILNLKAGYTIYLFTLDESKCFQKILEIEKTLF